MKEFWLQFHELKIFPFLYLVDALYERTILDSLDPSFSVKFSAPRLQLEVAGEAKQMFPPWLSLQRPIKMCVFVFVSLVCSIRCARSTLLRPTQSSTVNESQQHRELF